MKKPYLSVVVPAYNEVDNLKKGVLDTMYGYLKSQDYSWEIVLANDASTDDTLMHLKKFAKGKKNVKVLDEPHRGKAGTVIAGVLAAQGDIILFTDMDQATPLDQVENLLPYLNSHDIAIGSRSGREGAPLVRKAMAFGFSVLRTIILRLPYKDTQCGFKAFKKSAARDIFKRLKIFDEKTRFEGAAVNAGFDIEILYVARKLGLKVKEVPVKWEHKGTKRVDALKDSIEGFKNLLNVRINAFQGKYKV